MSVQEMENQFDESHVTGHVVSAAAIVGSWLGIWIGIVPVLVVFITSCVALIWYLLQIYENPTVQRWLRTRRSRKIAYLRARAIGLEARQKYEAAVDDSIKSKPLH